MSNALKRLIATVVTLAILVMTGANTAGARATAPGMTAHSLAFCAGSGKAHDHSGRHGADCLFCQLHCGFAALPPLADAARHARAPAALATSGRATAAPKHRRALAKVQLPRAPPSLC